MASTKLQRAWKSDTRKSNGLIRDQSQKLSTVAEGEPVSMSLMLMGEKKRRVVTVGAYHPSAPGNESGHWYCVTHGDHFDNQFQKDSHIHTGTHRLAWICHEHGIEQPMKEVVQS